jgi:FkbM family methyltransferase
MSSSVNERKAKRSFESFKLYVGTRMGRAIRRIVGKNTVLPIVAGRLKGKKWTVGAGIPQILGMWQEMYTDKFAESIYQSSVVYDVGAHGGWYTLLASELVGPRGKVVAFEPLPSVLTLLKRNVEINHCTNVQIVEAAVSDNDGTATFFALADGTLGSLSPSYGPNTTTVKTVKIDSLVREKIIPAPYVIKMDIEGGELAALKGAESMLVEHAPMIFLETHGFDMCVDCCRVLTSLGYAVERFHGSGTMVAHKV